MFSSRRTMHAGNRALKTVGCFYVPTKGLEAGDIKTNTNGPALKACLCPLAHHFARRAVMTGVADLTEETPAASLPKGN